MPSSAIFGLSRQPQQRPLGFRDLLAQVLFQDPGAPNDRLRRSLASRPSSSRLIAWDRHITGIAELELELVPKRMEVFHELIPGLQRVLLVYDATNAFAVSRVHRDAAHRLGLTRVERPVRTEDEARSVISANPRPNQAAAVEPQ